MNFNHLKRISQTALFTLVYGLIFSSCLFAQETPGAFNRGMQNLTAHYNIYYNANEILKTSESNIRAAGIDDYNRLLDIYPIATEEISNSETAKLDLVITKANTIALEKFSSRWVDDAYLLLARAEYWKLNYYNASEYFNYVNINFPKDIENRKLALIWQARSMMALYKYKDADTAINEAYELETKKYDADMYSANAQLLIYAKDFEKAEKDLKLAIKLTNEPYFKIRWRYILAQLQVLNKKPEEAYVNFLAVTRSNSSFELSFQAELNRIELQEVKSGSKNSRIAALQRLLKEDKNLLYRDQIYYNLANVYNNEQQLELAEENYKKSVSVSSQNNTQKGLSYLSLSELKFNKLKDYAAAKNYYDSTLLFLPKTYPGYEILAKKAENLQYLADRMVIIAEQDTLLALAALSPDDREEKLTAMANSQIQKETVANKNKADFSGSYQENLNFEQTATTNNPGSFYFNNPSAISQGLNEFKSRWGNRKLQDNWRRSGSSPSLEAIATANLKSQPIDPDQNPFATTITSNIDTLKKNFAQNLPLSAEQKKLSETKIIDAYVEVANFYKEVIEDNNEAINTFELLLKRFPENKYLDNIYFQLYRLYDPVNKERSAYYKNLLFKQFPTSVYAKSLTDPDFGREDELSIAKVERLYTEIYNFYTAKNYANVITAVDSAKNNLEQPNYASAKFDYLKALAIGFTKPVDDLVVSLQAIETDYPTDTLVVPRVKDQLAFIEKNKDIFNKRSIALVANNNEGSFVAVTLTEPVIAKETPKTEGTTPVEKPVVEEVVLTPPKPETTIAPTPGVVTFNKNIRIKHYIVVDVLDAKQNIAQAFASLTQYFYLNFEPGKIQLNLRLIGNNKLIIAGTFDEKNKSAAVLKELQAKLPDLMKLPEEKYTSFIISEPNLQLTNTPETLAQYLKYYKEQY